MKVGHVSRLRLIHHYQSPKGRFHNPRVIKPKNEEIEVIVSGRGIFRNGNQVFDAGPGSNVWYYAGEVVEVTSHDQTPYETIVFCFEYDEEPERRAPFQSRWEDAAECERFCRQALEEHQLGTPDPIYFPACVYAKLYWECMEYSRRQEKKDFPAALKRSVRFIEESYRKKLTIDDIAVQADLSPPHLHLLFRRYLRDTPLGLVRKHRLNMARQMLSATRAPLKVICEQTGFGDVKNFCDFFKKNSGMTPTQYRKMNA